MVTRDGLVVTLVVTRGDGLVVTRDGLVVTLVVTRDGLVVTRDGLVVTLVVTWDGLVVSRDGQQARVIPANPGRNWRELAGTGRELGGHWAGTGRELAGTDGNWAGTGGNWAELAEIGRELAGTWAGTGGNCAETGGDWAGTGGGKGNFKTTPANFKTTLLLVFVANYHRRNESKCYRLFILKNDLGKYRNQRMALAKK